MAAIKFSKEDYMNAQFEVAVLFGFRYYVMELQEKNKDITMDDIYVTDDENNTLIFKTMTVDEVKDMFFTFDELFPTAEYKDVA